MHPSTYIIAVVSLCALPACSSSDSSGAKKEPYPPPAPDSCITDVTPGNQALECEGLKFQLTVPDACLTQPCGFITDVHGFGMDSGLMELHSRMQKIAVPKGYIVMQPSAPGQILQSQWSEANDAQVYALMQHVINVWHPDPKRIHFDGYSMGGWMTWRFLCKHSDILASVAPIAAGLQSPGCSFAGTEMPARKVPILYTHGRNDGLVPFAQAIPQRDAVVAAWYPGVTPQVLKQDTDYEWDRYTSPDGNIFEFIQHDWECHFLLGSFALKGHCFPGSDQFLGCDQPYPDGGPPLGGSHQMIWGETVLQFFIDHPMK